MYCLCDAVRLGEVLKDLHIALAARSTVHYRYGYGTYRSFRQEKVT